jgi:hypothetical protein
MLYGVPLAPAAAASPRERPVGASQASGPVRFLASLPAHYQAGAAGGERAAAPDPA